MLKTMMLALGTAALSAAPALAQDQAAAPVEAAPVAAAPVAAQAVPAAMAPPAKQSFAERMAIAAGLLTAGVAAFQALKHSKAAPAPADGAAATAPVTTP